MNKPFKYGSSLLLANTVVAILHSAVDEAIVCAGERWAGVPLRRVLGDIADEEEDGEAPTNLVLLHMNARGPVEVGAIARAGSRWGTIDTEGRGALPTGEREHAEVAIYLVDLLGDFAADGLWIPQVKSVELGIRVSELGGRCDFGGLPVSRLSIPERGQVYPMLDEWVWNDISVRTCLDTNSAPSARTIDHPHAWVDRRPERQHSINVGVMEVEDGVERLED